MEISASRPGTGEAPPASATPSAEKTVRFERIVQSLSSLMEDASVPRNIRRGAESARQELLRAAVALDVRVASAVYVLDDLANDSNLPTHGRTAIWSIISNLESLQ